MLPILENRRYEFAVEAGAGSQFFGFDVYLFLQNHHLKTQAADRLITFQLQDLKTNKIVAYWPVFINSDKIAYSPGRAPFGGPQFAAELPATAISEFLREAHQYLLQTENAIEIRIKSYPVSYAPVASNILTHTLIRCGFQVDSSEINHHIPVSGQTLESQLHASARRRLVKCQRHGFTFQEESSTFLPKAFDFIERCRAEKNYALSLAFPQVKALFEQFPFNFRIFSVKTPVQELAACTIAVRINSEVLYNFYPASPQQFNTFSPTIFLTAGLYQVCQQEGFQLLDLGTSMLADKPNFPLIAFKKHLGGEAGLKLSFLYTNSPK